MPDDNRFLAAAEAAGFLGEDHVTWVRSNLRHYQKKKPDMTVEALLLEMQWMSAEQVDSVHQAMRTADDRAARKTAQADTPTQAAPAKPAAVEVAEASESGDDVSDEGRRRLKRRRLDRGGRRGADAAVSADDADEPSATPAADRPAAVKAAPKAEPTPTPTPARKAEPESAPKPKAEPTAARKAEPEPARKPKPEPSKAKNPPANDVELPSKKRDANPVLLDEKAAQKPADGEGTGSFVMFPSEDQRSFGTDLFVEFPEEDLAETGVDVPDANPLKGGAGAGGKASAGKPTASGKAPTGKLPAGKPNAKQPGGPAQKLPGAASPVAAVLGLGDAVDDDDVQDLRSAEVESLTEKKMAAIPAVPVPISGGPAFVAKDPHLEFHDGPEVPVEAEDITDEELIKITGEAVKTARDGMRQDFAIGHGCKGVAKSFRPLKLVCYFKNRYPGAPDGSFVGYFFTAEWCMQYDSVTGKTLVCLPEGFDAEITLRPASPEKPGEIHFTFRTFDASRIPGPPVVLVSVFRAGTIEEAAAKAIHERVTRWLMRNPWLGGHAVPTTAEPNEPAVEAMPTDAAPVRPTIGKGKRPTRKTVDIPPSPVAAPPPAAVAPPPKKPLRSSTDDDDDNTADRRVGGRPLLGGKGRMLDRKDARGGRDARGDRDRDRDRHAPADRSPKRLDPRGDRDRDRDRDRGDRGGDRDRERDKRRGDDDRGRTPLKRQNPAAKPDRADRTGRLDRDRDRDRDREKDRDRDRGPRRDRDARADRGPAREARPERGADRDRPNRGDRDRDRDRDRGYRGDRGGDRERDRDRDREKRRGGDGNKPPMRPLGAGTRKIADDRRPAKNRPKPVDPDELDDVEEVEVESIDDDIEIGGAGDANEDSLISTRSRHHEDLDEDIDRFDVAQMDEDEDDDDEIEEVEVESADDDDDDGGAVPPRGRDKGRQRGGGGAPPPRRPNPPPPGRRGDKHPPRRGRD